MLGYRMSIQTTMFSIFLLILGLIYTSTAQDDFSCGPGKPCKIGCCSKYNVCGMGPTFCGAGNCTSECGAKSECDPGFGSEWAQQEKCPLNVCCSKFGFCKYSIPDCRRPAFREACPANLPILMRLGGTTEEFCGDKKVDAPSCGGTSSNERTIGYYEGWSHTRSCDSRHTRNQRLGHL